MSDTPSYTELKQMHAEATRMRDEAFEYRAEAERKLVEANYLFGQTAKGVAGGGGSSGRGTPLRPPSTTQSRNHPAISALDCYRYLIFYFFQILNF